MSDLETVYALTGQDNGAKAVFNDVGASIARAADRTDKAAKSVSDLAAKLDRSAAAAGKAATEANKAEIALASMGQGASYAVQQIPGVGGAMSAVAAGPMVAVTAGAVAVGAAFVGAVKSGIDFADSLNDLSDRLGVPIETLSRLAPVAELGGTSLESLSNILGKFAQKVATGNKEIKDLKLTTTDAVGAMVEIADKVQAAGSQTEAIAIAQAAYGKQWQELMPILKMGGSYINQVMGSAAVVTAQTAAQAAKIKDEFTLLQNKTLNISLGIAESVMPQIELWLEGVEKIRKAMGLITFDEKKAIERTAIIAKYADQQQANREAGLNGAPSWFLQKIGANKINGKTLEQALAEVDAKYTAPAATPTGPAPLSVDQIAAAEKEVAFRKDLARQIEELTAQADQRELIAIQNKYAKLIEEHKGYAKTVQALRAAQLVETQAYYANQAAAMRDNADKAFVDATGISWDLYSSMNPGVNESEQGSRSLTKSMRASRESVYSPGGTQQNYRSSSLFQENSIPGQSLASAIANTPDSQMQRWVDSGAGPEEIIKNYENAMADLQKTADGVAQNIASAFSGEVAPAIMKAFTDPANAIEIMGNAVLGVVGNIGEKLLDLMIQFAALSFFSSMFGSSKPLDFKNFILKGFGGHADGTLSSPGGFKYLGEVGPELVTTPLGDRYMASYGLYHVPAGTRVDASSKASGGGTKEFHLHTTQSDPIQVAEQFRRIVREEIAIYQGDEYRSRLP